MFLRSQGRIFFILYIYLGGAMTRQDGQASYSARNWCGTLNNYLEEDVEQFQFFIEEHCKYGVFQRECGANGTEHLQAYVMLTQKIRLTGLVKLTGKRWHWEVRKGTHEQARDYCKKEESRVPGTEPQEFGNDPKPGKRNDIKEFVASIRGGRSDVELLEEYPGSFLRFTKHINLIRGMYRGKPTFREPEVIVKWGETGTGKTRDCYRECGEEVWESLPGQGKWFDGYMGQPDVILDDFRAEIPYGQFLRMLDGYGCPVEVKGGTTWWHPKRIWITANSHPDTWYTYTSKDPWDAFKRRISKCQEYRWVDAESTVVEIVNNFSN